VLFYWEFGEQKKPLHNVGMYRLSSSKLGYEVYVVAQHTRIGTFHGLCQGFDGRIQSTVLELLDKINNSNQNMILSHSLRSSVHKANRTRAKIMMKAFKDMVPRPLERLSTSLGITLTATSNQELFDEINHILQDLIDEVQQLKGEYKTLNEYKNRLITIMKLGGVYVASQRPDIWKIDTNHREYINEKFFNFHNLLLTKSLPLLDTMNKNNYMIFSIPGYEHNPIYPAFIMALSWTIPCLLVFDITNTLAPALPLF